jgi:uncharacterized integral membrane protein (TIGR00698 family)
MDTNKENSQAQKNHVFTTSIRVKQILYVLALCFCLTPLFSPPLALLLGVVIANLIGNPFTEFTKKAANVLLQLSVVGLGFGMNVNVALQAGSGGFLFTILFMLVALALGYLLGKWLKVEAKVAHLISCGTAICGGSAIATISPIIKAEEKQISVAIGTVFILNAVALFLFPFIGHWFNLSQNQFGIWSAIAIHDTSSVIGAANKYGAEALQIATTIKLTRSLWIIPVAFITAIFYKNKYSQVKIPYFIGLFLLAIIVNTYVAGVAEFSDHIISFSKISLTVTLFLIGSRLSFSVLKLVGLKALLFGIMLWAFLSVTTLAAVINFTS